jgi:hypothetical protein
LVPDPTKKAEAENIQVTAVSDVYK